MIDVTEIDLTPLYDLADECIEIYHNEIKRIGAEGYNKGLSHSTANWKQTGNNTITLTFELPYYHVFVEEGRNPSKSKQDPKYVYEQILKWVKAKNITPRPTRRIYKTKKGEVRRGKLYTPTQEQLAWAIYNKIHKAGYYGYNQAGKHPLEHTLALMQHEGLGKKAVYEIAKQYGDALHAEILSLKDYKKK